MVKQTYEINLKDNDSIYKTLKTYYNPENYVLKKEYAENQIKMIDSLYQQNKFDELDNMLNLVLHNNINKKYKSYCNFQITLKDLYQNETEVYEKCKSCNGTGKSVYQTCKKCEGTKTLNFGIMNKYNFNVRRVDCDECDGEGVIGLDSNCQICNGIGDIYKTIKSLFIPKNNITYFEINDINFLFTNEDQNFLKKNLNLIYNKEISLKEIMHGFQFNINLFDLKKITIISIKNKIYNPDIYYKVSKLGFKSGNDIGDLLIKFIVKYPETLDDFYETSYIFEEKMQEVYII